MSVFKFACVNCLARLDAPIRSIVTLGWRLGLGFALCPTCLPEGKGPYFCELPHRTIDVYDSFDRDFLRRHEFEGFKHPNFVAAGDTLTETLPAGATCAPVATQDNGPPSGPRSDNSNSVSFVEQAPNDPRTMTIVCLGCKVSRFEYGSFPLGSEGLKAMGEAGWSLTGGKVLCPGCALVGAVVKGLPVLRERPAARLQALFSSPEIREIKARLAKGGLRVFEPGPEKGFLFFGDVPRELGPLRRAQASNKAGGRGLLLWYLITADPGAEEWWKEMDDLAISVFVVANAEELEAVKAEILKARPLERP